MSLPGALQKIDCLARRFPHRFPSAYTRTNKYDADENVGWTPGFWAGLLWLAYQHSGERHWRERAEGLNRSFASRLDAGGAGTETHDLGFLYTLSSIACWRLTGDETARQVALRAAALLMKRYWTGGRVIQAWGSMDDIEQHGRIIVDSTMNLPLLFWAADAAGQPRLREAAVNHLDQCVRYLVRSDGSTFHTFYVDTVNGEGRYGKTHQGFADESCWSRGQAWAIYGFALAYRHTGDTGFRDVARKVAGYFLDHLPPDDICSWDLVFYRDSQQERDSSAAAIAASGLLELAGHLPAADSECLRLRAAAHRLLEILSAKYLSTDPAEDGILLNGVYNRPQGHGVNESCLWGDYFFVEALMRQDARWASFW